MMHGKYLAIAVLLAALMPAALFAQWVRPTIDFYGRPLDATVFLSPADQAVPLFSISAGKWGVTTSFGALTSFPSGKVAGRTTAGSGAIEALTPSSDILVSVGAIGLTVTTVTAGTYGDGQNVAQFTVDTRGRLTAAGTAAILVSNAQVSGSAAIAHSKLANFGGTSQLLGSTSASAAPFDVTLGTGLSMSAGGVLSVSAAASLEVQSGGSDVAGSPATGLNFANGLQAGAVSGGISTVQPTYGSSANTVTQGNDSRLSDARTPTAHATSHKNGGSDEVATATAAANAIPKAGAGGTLAAAWIQEVITLADLSDVTVTSAAAYDIIYRNAGNTAWINLAKGANSTVLQISSGGVLQYATITSAMIADGTITDADMAANTLTTASMATSVTNRLNVAPGTLGQITVSATSGAGTALGQGTFGQILTSAGSAAAPTFSDAASSDNFEYGLRAAQLSNSTAQVTITAIVATDSNNAPKVFRSVAQTTDITVSGAGGLDTGSEASSTWYAWWFIGKVDGTESTVLHADTAFPPTRPTMPSGYTYAAHIGWIRNNGSSNFEWFRQQSRTVQLKYVSTALLNAGTATSATAIDASAYFPPGAYTGIVQPFITATSTATSLDVIFSDVLSGNSSGELFFQGATGATGQQIIVPAMIALNEARNFNYRTQTNNNVSVGAVRYTF